VRLRLASIAVVSFLAMSTVHGERLPVQSFTLAQGLISNSIYKIVRDSRGFLWFCTGEGLSRFDGHQFVNFGVSQGLPGLAVLDFIESRTGDYWAAVSGGLARISGEGGYHVQVVAPADDVSSKNVLAVKETSDGAIWAGTEGGLYRLLPGARTMTRVDTGPLPESWSNATVWALEEDGIGSLWFGTETAGIGRITKEGHVDRWTPHQQFISHVVVTLSRDTDGSIWAGTEQGICHMLRSPRHGELPTERCYGLKNGLPGLYTQSIRRTTDGTLWVATTEGAAFAKPAEDGILRFTALTRREGLVDDDISAVAEDIEGNVWLGAADDGVMKLPRGRVSLFTEAEGLAAPNVIGFLEDRHHTLYAVTRSPSGVMLNRFDGKQFIPVRPNTKGIRAFGRGFQQVALQDHAGRWWIATAEGLLRYRPGDVSVLGQAFDALMLPVLPDGGNVFRVFEDSRGDIWWSTSGHIVNGLARWNQALGKIEIFSEGDGLPPLRSNTPTGFNLPTAFVEDRHGTLWFGFQSGGLARRKGDRFEYFPTSYSPIGRMRSSYRDNKSRLWFGSSTGVWRLDDPDAAKPVLRQYTVTKGLSSDTVFSVTGDLQDRIYVGTAKGLDRLDPESGQVEHLSSADGFPAGVVQAAYRDKEGNLWFATRQGVARVGLPREFGSETLPAVRITTIKVRGNERPLSAGGEATLASMQFAPDEDQIQFDFVAPNFRGDTDLLYQYRLEGTRSQEWSPPSTTRSINFASLPAGSYRFVVRAVSSQGAVNAAPATVTFRILPPFWMTWWFRAAMGLIVIATVYALYRYRMAVILERERLRFRIATDLHDDIGSSLSSIAIWSDVAVRQAERVDKQMIQPLQQIGMVSREVIDSVSDIVWAINPRHDRFTDLASRMRRHVGDLAAAVPFSISFEIEGNEREANVGPVFRREVFLIFKEALNNVVRHSECTKCAASLRLTSGWMTLEISDNGKGFDTKTTGDGNGLDSMRRRAEDLGGTLRIASAPSQATLIELHVPTSGKPERTGRPVPHI
jgi:ligand-binding sensor domain-containing protein/signal transduction histidine kinase